MNAALGLLDRDRILAGLTDAARAGLSRLEVYSVLDSTNSYLLSRIDEDWPSGAVCLAEQQQAGRGRQGRSWLSPFAAGLAGSLLWRFPVSAAALSGLSLATGIAVARALRQIGVAEVGLKWPNDVGWRGRKLGGILLESGGQAGAFFVVAGVGLNVALPKAEATAIDQPWVDLAEILGAGRVSRNHLAALLISELIETFFRFQHSGFASLAAEWANFDQVAGRQVRLNLPNATVIGIARGVDATGALLLETAEGRITPYIGGEISLRIEP
ncbi:MAG: biotin--[acetyl-CoA-carboxylase] ligase [Candidatus Competibacter sp.]|nr:biotin--[acetyl-CoA-carboxylase] ligase [Candidatus Competibacter sp.]MDG4606189.1 biotin--[acetyl-CoA-carboxylase] ligase [Candidatus Contendobacter sp.]HRD48861.1 biotin--[acetyl-CoA-carboxylase] ligase [Candidatus Contendobacter sp.]